MLYVGICDDEKGTCAELENILYDYGRKKGTTLDVSVWYTSCRIQDWTYKEGVLPIIRSYCVKNYLHSIGVSFLAVG